MLEIDISTGSSLGYFSLASTSYFESYSQGQEHVFLQQEYFRVKLLSLFFLRIQVNICSFLLPKYSEQKFQKVAYEEVLLLIAGLKYTPSSIIFMKVPSISKFQWHSFSISSSSVVDSQTMSVLIKCEGRWTSSLYNMIQAKLDADQVKCMPIAIEGPYGPSSLNFLRYPEKLLVFSAETLQLLIANIIIS